MAVYTSRNVLICAVPAVVAIMTIIWLRRRKKRSTGLIHNQMLTCSSTAENNSSIKPTKATCDDSEVKLLTCGSSAAEVVEPILLETSDGAFSRPSKNDVNIYEVQLHKKNIFEVQESSESKCSITMVPESIDAMVETSKLDNHLQPSICETDDIVQERNTSEMTNLPDVICDESLDEKSSISNSDNSRTNSEDVVRDEKSDISNSDNSRTHSEDVVGDEKSDISNSDNSRTNSEDVVRINNKNVIVSASNENETCGNQITTKDSNTRLNKYKTGSFEDRPEYRECEIRCLQDMKASTKLCGQLNLTLREPSPSVLKEPKPLHPDETCDGEPDGNNDCQSALEEVKKIKETLECMGDDHQPEEVASEEVSVKPEVSSDDSKSETVDQSSKCTDSTLLEMNVTLDSKTSETENSTITKDLNSKNVEMGDKEDKLGQNHNSMQQAVMDETGNNSSQGHYSDVHSEGSSDSGKGGSDIQLSTEYAHFPMSDDALTVYEFELPQDLCGRLIGRQGKCVNYIKNHSNANVFIRKHPVNPRMKLCTIEGSALEIGAALELIRRRFPPSQFPNVTLVQFNTNGNARGAPIPETLQLSWLNQSCLLFQKKLLPFHSHFQNASVYHHITEIQLHLPEGVSCDVIMSSMVTAGHFFLQQPTHPTYSNLNRLDTCMSACYTQMETPQLPRPVEAGVICAAPVISGWYRAQVVYICESMEECDVKFVDYGGYSRVPISSLRQIRSDFMTLPFQASECYLANVQSLEEDGSWPVEACATFEELAQGQILQAQIVGYAEDSIPFVHLYKLQGISTIFINRELVNRGVAQWIEHQ